MALLKLIAHSGRQYWHYIVAVLVLQLISAIAALWLPSLNAQVIDQGIATGDTGFIWRTGGIMLSVSLAQVVSAIGAVYFSARAAMGMGRDLRRRVYRKATSLSTMEATRFGAATLITRGTNDVQQIQLLVLMGLMFLVTAPMMAIGGIVMALNTDAGLSWLVWVAVVILAAIVTVFVAFLLPLFREMQERVDQINGVLREQIIGIRVVRAFVREHFEANRYRLANKQITDVSVRVGAVFVLMLPVIMMVLHLSTGAVVWFGGQRADAGTVEVGSLTAFMQYLLQILSAVIMCVFIVMATPRAIVCAERLTELLDAGSAIAYPQDQLHATPAHGRLEFQNVTFGFPGAELPVIKDASFVAEPGRTTAIIGSTGAGKSTIVNLAVRLLEPQQGAITIDDIPISELTRSQLAATISLVPQRSYLFSGTIGSNLRFGRADATDAELWEALRVAQGEDFVREKRNGLGSRVSQGGTNISGGQRQRLSIARALVAKPRIYLFDDSFSALDVGTDARLRAALPSLTEGATTIIVAQRVSTITDADQILVIDNGLIVARGRHEQLLETSAVYREIVESQTDTEEAA